MSNGRHFFVRHSYKSESPIRGRALYRVGDAACSRKWSVFAVCADSQSDGILWIRPAREFIPMASAILLFYTSQGFLIAADGRARGNGTVLTDCMTKIFSISKPPISLAYAFGGTVALTDKDDP